MNLKWICPSALRRCWDVEIQSVMPNSTVVSNSCDHICMCICKSLPNYTERLPCQLYRFVCSKAIFPNTNGNSLYGCVKQLRIRFRSVLCLFSRRITISHCLTQMWGRKWKVITSGHSKCTLNTGSLNHNLVICWYKTVNGNGVNLSAEVEASFCLLWF